MIRLLCPYCHTSLSARDLEHATLQGHACLICPECSSVLLSESPLDEVSHGIDEHFAHLPELHA